MPRTAVSDKWRGRFAWSLDETQNAARALGVPLAALFARSEGLEPPTFWLGVAQLVLGVVGLLGAQAVTA